MFTFAIDKVRLLDHFKKDPVLFAYHIGDLDDFFFPHCQFPSIYSSTARIEDTILIYTGGTAPIVALFGLTERYDDLIREITDFLPDKFSCHFQGRYRKTLHERYREKPLGTMLRMKLETLNIPQIPAHQVVRLDESDLKPLAALYKSSYPSSYFTPRMMKTGKYFGVRDGKKLIAVAGVHVYSREYKIAALGNITTHKDFRGKGLATAVTGHLCRELVDEGLMVCLSVKADNVSAIACYQKLGFVKACEFEESSFASK